MAACSLRPHKLAILTILALLGTLLGTLFLCACSAPPRARVGPAPDAGIPEPRPAKRDTAHIGYDTPDEPPTLAEALLFLPALFFVGATVEDDVVTGPPRTRLIGPMMRERSRERLPRETLPPEVVESLQRAFAGPEERRDFLSPDRTPPPPKSFDSPRKDR